MKTNLTLLLLLVGVGLASLVGIKSNAVPLQQVPVMSTINTDMSDGVTTGVRYVYIQFPGDTTQVVKLQELNSVINERVVEYNDTSEPSTEVADD